MGDTCPNHRKRQAARRHRANLPRVALLASSAMLAVGLFMAYGLGWWDAARAVFSSVEAMRGFVAGFGAWAPAVFFLAQVAQVLLAPIPGGVTVVVGTLLFGAWGGLALSVAGATVGSALLFLAVRRWGRHLARRLVGNESFERYVGVLDERGTLLFVVMLVPFMPDDVVAGLAGLSAVSLRRFVVFVAVGRTPSWALTSLVTADLATRSAAVWIVALLTAAAILALGVWHCGRLESWLVRLVGKGRKR